MPESAPTVLILEDSPELAEILQVTLMGMGLTVHAASHANKAVEIFQQVSPDLLILDIGLPDEPGWKALKRMREERQDGPFPKVLVVTAYGDPANRLMGKLQGVSNYLVKPLTPAEIEREVRRVLDLKRD